jgi:ABC-type tungstate transport system permease subunit
VALLAPDVARTLEVFVQGDSRLLNVFAVLPVDPAAVPGVDGAEAARFVAWLLSEPAQALIAGLGADGQGIPRFVPRAGIAPAAGAAAYGRSRVRP